MVKLSRVVPSLSNVKSCGKGYGSDLAFPVYPFPHLVGRTRPGGGAMGEASGETNTTPL
jgi:hypothetical protein